MIGDGMGPAQWQAGDLASRQLTGEPTRMETLPVRGLLVTRSAKSEVTDSAAAVTAMASGVKTNNGMLNVTPDGQTVEPLIVPLAEAGMRIGLLSSVPPNHATPAGFFAQAPSRNMYDRISLQLLDRDVNLLLGNGLLSDNDRQNAVMEKWAREGLTVARTLDEVAAAPADARVAAVLSFPVAKVEARDPAAAPGALALATAAAIERLQGPEGFFLMVEGGKIDWAGHSNDSLGIVEETLAFDRAVEFAYRFYLEHRDETLLLVTADHETGGMRIDPDRFDVNRLRELEEFVAPFNEALGPESSLSLEKVEQAMGDVLGVSDLSDQERDRLATALENTSRRKWHTSKTAQTIANERAGVAWSTGGHTSTDVPITAIGVGAERFEGTLDNTELPGKILQACLPDTTDLPQAQAALAAIAPEDAAEARDTAPVNNPAETELQPAGANRARGLE